MSRRRENMEEQKREGKFGRIGGGGRTGTGGKMWRKIKQS